MWFLCKNLHFSKPLLEISTLVHLCNKIYVKPEIGLNGQKMEEQMSRREFDAKIYIFLYYGFLIQAFIENFDLCTPLY